MQQAAAAGSGKELPSSDYMVANFCYSGAAAGCSTTAPIVQLGASRMQSHLMADAANPLSLKLVLCVACCRVETCCAAACAATAGS